MSVALAESPILSFLNNAGQLNAGGSLLTQVGGVNYPTYQDSGGVTALPNPIPLNSRGEISNASGISCQLFLQAATVYTFTLYDANGNQLWTANDVMGIAQIAVGNMTNENGIGGQPGFVNGVDFTAGTTTSLTLSQNYGSASNLWVSFDGVDQGADTYSLSGKTLTFNAPIPVGTNKVYVKGGTALTISAPASGSITDASIATGTKLFNRITQVVFATDPQYAGGADPTGVNDSTAAMQAAHNTGKLVYYPGGTYKTSAPVTMIGGGAFGDGQNSTYFTTTQTTGDFFTWNGAGSVTPQGAPNGPVFHGFTMTAPLQTPTSGSLIDIAPSSGEISYFEIYGITFNGGFNHIGITAASHYKIHDNNFLNYNNNGILMQNTNNPDSGDSCVYGNLFNCGFTGTAAQAGIQHISSSGTKIFGNKFLGGRYNYFMNASIAGAGLGGVYIVGNSMEAASTASMQLNRTSASGTWGGVVIADNEFGGAPNTIVCNGANFLSNVNVANNVFTQIPASGVGIVLDNQFDWSISGNKFEGSNSGTIGIETGAGVTSLHVGINTYTQMATPVAFGAPSQTVMDLTPQAVATFNVVTNTAYGSLFSGSQAITWPKGFLVAPSTFATNINNGASGGVSVLITGATTNGATATVIGVTNGGSVPVNITAFGIA